MENGEARLRSADVAVPATIHDIIAARVDRLTDPLKRTLQGAAVIGRRFGVSLLSRVLETSGEQMIGQLGELHRLDFIFPAARDPEPMYSFKHALTQDVVYGGLLERRRRQYHAAAGARARGALRGAARRRGGAPRVSLRPQRRRPRRRSTTRSAPARRRRSGGRTPRRSRCSRARSSASRPCRTARPTGCGVSTPCSSSPRSSSRSAATPSTSRRSRRSARSSRPPPILRAGPPGTAGRASSTASPARAPRSPSPSAGRPSEIAEEAGLEELRAFAECCLTHVYVVSGELRAAIEAGERALAVFEARHNAWWACRTLFGLSMAANALGEWAAEPRVLSPGRRVRPGARTICDSRWSGSGEAARLTSSGVPSIRACSVARTRSPCHRSPSTNQAAASPASAGPAAMSPALITP